VLKFRASVSCSGNTVEPTTIEVYPNRAEFALHPRRERLHDCNITIKSYADELDMIRWGKGVCFILYGRQIDRRTGISTTCDEGAFKNECTQPQALCTWRVGRDCRRGRSGPTAGQSASLRE
jgi:hypothetical protein